MTTMTTSARIGRGLGSVLLLVVLLVGIPAGLWVVAGSPIPEALPTWAQIQSALSSPDVTGGVFLGILKYVGWIAWATFAIAILIELGAALRGVQAPSLRGFGVQQRTAAALIGAVVAMLTVGPIATAAPVAALPDAPSHSISVSIDAPLAQVAETPAATPAAPELQTYTVTKGDSLWSIAKATLGDGSRFQEIADLNLGVEQADGYALDGSNWIEPGWVLTLPLPAEQTAAPVPATTEADNVVHTVAPGESLFSIAEAALGDGDRYMELYEASRDLVQPDGSRLEDPSLIRPGWTIALPATPTATPAAPPVIEAPAEVTPEISIPEPAPEIVEPSLVDTAAETPEQAAAPAASTAESSDQNQDTTDRTATDVDDQDDVDDDGFPVDARTATGIGGLLAAGVLTLLAARRAAAQRRRRAGQRIAMPVPATGPSTLEAEMRAVADPLGRDTVNKALRSLATWHREQGLPLPDVRAARLAPGSYFELYLDHAADFPAPWVSTADRHVWQLTSDDAAGLEVTEDAAAGEAPYPSLVTIGHDEEDAHFMLDLEQLGCLDIRGNDDAGEATLAALAIELATSPWADDLQVTLVGTLAELPGVVDTGRVRHVSGLANIVRELEARANDVEKALTQAGATSLADARGRAISADSWTPEILLIGEHLDPTVRDALERLIARVPGVGIAAVTNASHLGEWILDLDVDDPTRGILHPAQMTIRPQQIDAETYAAAIELLADADPLPGPAWGRNLTETEPALADIPVTVEVIEAVAAAAGPSTEPASVDYAALGLSLIEQRAARQMAAASDVVAPSAPVEPLTVDETSVEAAEETPAALPVVGQATELVDVASDEAAPTVVASITKLRPPVVRILGPVELDVASGVDMQPSHQRQATELISFLAFTPGASGADISAALWPTREPNLSTRRSAVSRARRWLGTDADGHEHLPRYWSTDDGAQVDQETAGYRLLGVTTDWTTFLELVGDDVTSTPLPHLVQALNLVRGRPFEGVAARKYVWAETLMQEISSSIVDVAHEVARRALTTGDVSTARFAAQVGRLADPADERSWRDAIRAEWASNQPEAINRLVEQLRDNLEDLDVDPAEETEALIAEVDDLNARRTRTAARRQGA